MAVEYDISSDVAVIKETGSVSQCARVTQMYSGQITYDDEAGSKFATATINGKSQRVMLCIAVSGTVTYDDVPSLYSTVDGHRCLNIVTPTETGTPDDVPSVYETVVIDGKNVRAVRCILINETPIYDGVSSTCTFVSNGKTHTAQLVNQVSSSSIETIVKGISPLSLPDAIANSLQYVKAFGGTEQNGTPTPTNPVDIVSNNGVLKYSKNLLDMSAENIVLGKYINNSGAVADSPANFYNSKYIPVVAGGTYTWSTSSSISYFSVMEYGSDYAFKKRTLFSNAGTSGSITLRSDTAFVLIGSNMDSTDVTLDKITAVDWQFEKGSSATAYKPYSPTRIYIDGTVETIKDSLNNTATTEMLLKVGDYQDEQQILTGVVTRKVGVKVLDGTENFETATATNCYSLTNTLGTGNFADRTIVCSHFASTPTMPGTGDRQGLAFIVNKGPEYTIAFGATTQFSTQALWQQFLADQYAAGTPVIIIYPLATSTTELVTGQHLQVTDGDNTLEITQASLTGLELEAKYSKNS